MTEQTTDITIIGAGPAGLAAGIYAARARLKVRLLEKLGPGGQIMNTDWVENYPGFPEGLSGFDISDKMKEHAQRFGVEIELMEVTGLERREGLIQVSTPEGGFATRALIIASGAQPARLGAQGEEELTGRGVSYCATCDGPFYRDQEVLVVGGGDTAVEEALFLTRFASKVTLVHRRDELRAVGILRERALAAEKVEILWSHGLNKVLADENGQVRAAELTDLKTGATRVQDVHGVFIFVGNRPNTGFLKGFVDLDGRGYVITDGEMAASAPGVFAAGDVRAKKLRQVVTAVGDGATAAFNAEKYIEQHFG